MNYQRINFPSLVNDQHSEQGNSKVSLINWKFKKVRNHQRQ